ncbi:hypothetical protein [Calothrix sp. PCC 7507]|uniref:allophanate hydrolase-related protein n=1 Tax=Calothrix sp. PCC 7507 TaxID=99598 RepID=UPI0002DD4C9B|nr:hypothetical protein [Calothrix sp. PCC 7507]
MPTVESPIALAVVGAHLTGQPLNYQLQERQARLLKTCKTASVYRLYALANTHPAKPGLVKVLDGSGVGIEVEVWELNADAFGTFVAAVPPPLVIGTLDLDDGSQVKGFLCEPYAIFPALGTAQAQDISHHGGWRNYLASQ